MLENLKKKRTKLMKFFFKKKGLKIDFKKRQKFCKKNKKEEN